MKLEELKGLKPHERKLLPASTSTSPRPGYRLNVFNPSTGQVEETWWDHDNMFDPDNHLGSVRE